MSTVEINKGPRPYHVGRMATRAFDYGAGQDVLAERITGYPADWTTPRYPGDSIMIVHLVKGDEIGDVRVQWYGKECAPQPEDSLKVGAFLPGVVECSPGDTPKVWPDKSVWVNSRALASKAIKQYLIEAFRDGWSVYKREAK